MKLHLLEHQVGLLQAQISPIILFSHHTGNLPLWYNSNVYKVVKIMKQNGGVLPYADLTKIFTDADANTVRTGIQRSIDKNDQNHTKTAVAG